MCLGVAQQAAHPGTPNTSGLVSVICVKLLPIIPASVFPKTNNLERAALRLSLLHPNPSSLSPHVRPQTHQLPSLPLALQLVRTCKSTGHLCGWTLGCVWVCVCAGIEGLGRDSGGGLFRFCSRCDIAPSWMGQSRDLSTGSVSTSVCVCVCRGSARLKRG